MAIVINGSGTVTGLSVGGLPDGTVDSDTLASSAVTEAKLANNAVVTGKIADGTIANADINDLAASKLTGTIATARLGTGSAGSGNFLRGDGSWQAAGSTSASDLTSGTLDALRLPAGAIVQVVKFSPSTTTLISIGSSSPPTFTEISSGYRLSITPKFSNSILRFTYTGLIGSNHSGALLSFKFYDITNSSNVGFSTRGSGNSRTFCNASYRLYDTDHNDRHNMIMTAYQAASNTTARTYGVYGCMESNETIDYNMTSTDNAGCTYVTPNFTIEEIAQ